MKTVLIADDSPTIRGFARLALRGLDVDLVEVEDGVQALEQLRRAVPALALVDVNMPHLGGLGLLTALRADADPALRALPVLLLTGERDEALLAQCTAAGATGVIEKPLRIAELKAKVAALLAQLAGEPPP